MGLVALFYYTLIILLVSIMTSAMCLSTFLVTHRKYLGFACIGFLFYFFDVALVFLDDFTDKFHRHHARIGLFHWIASHLDRYGLWAVHGFLAHGMRRA